LASATTSFTQPVVQDPLMYLPCAPILEYRRGSCIYAQDEPSSGLYLIIAGTVKVCRVTDEGCESVTDIYIQDEFFGESALLGSAGSREMAVALETTKVMRWTTHEIGEMLVKRPQLAIALTRVFAQRSIDFAQRIESLATDAVAPRLARTLIRLADRFGERRPDGSEQVTFPLTHQLLAQYVGTSRELVTQNMVIFRRRGCVVYSRAGFSLYRDVMQRWLAQKLKTR
jgi:CRP/FNR family cyclic AMP-dependent transcriptional regulator